VAGDVRDSVNGVGTRFYEGSIEARDSALTHAWLHGTMDALAWLRRKLQWGVRWTTIMCEVD
jgi:hypothetical protein